MAQRIWIFGGDLPTDTRDLFARSGSEHSFATSIERMPFGIARWSATGRPMAVRWHHQHVLSFPVRNSVFIYVKLRPAEDIVYVVDL
jgi:hypothetical protein